MKLEFDDLEALEKELEGLPPLHRVAFAASICERLLPNYDVFYREEAWGDPSILRTALDEVWQILQGKPLDEPKINQLMDDLPKRVITKNLSPFWTFSTRLNLEFAAL
ncbi:MULTISPECIES: DUF416 family protein [Aerosakkonema]|uniref:DUF416 family protein n=1 Tax=Aerosakkonema TaxID=1246629 RepID=UPI0035BA01BF